MKNNKYHIILLLFIVISSYSQNSVFTVLNIPENLKKDANSVVQKDEVLVSMTSQNSLTIKSQQVITVLNKLGDKHAQITLYYDKRRAIKNVVVYIYDAFGKEIKKIKKSDFTDGSVSDGFSLFRDDRYLHYKYIPISYPYTIQYISEIKTSNTAQIQGWDAISNYNQSVMDSKYTFEYPKYIGVQKTENNFEKYLIQTTNFNGKVSYQIKNIPAIKYEPNSPSFLETFPNVRLGVNQFSLEGIVGTANNWKEFGKWYYNNLIKNTQGLPESTRQKIIKLTSGVNDTIEKAKIIYNYVQNKVRYISVQVGIGGYKPMLASEVDNLGYGDCKALTNYTCALLKTVGIKAYPTLIYADEDDNRSIDEHVASPQGNHMILNLPIGNKNIWLECTSQKSPFGEIANFTDDRDALVITPQGGEIKHTKIYKAADNLQITKGNLTLDENGKLDAELAIHSTGSQYDDHLNRYDGDSPKELEISFKRYFSKINNIHLTKSAIKNNKEKGVFKEDLSFNAVDYATITNNQMLIIINAFNRNTYVPKRVKNRKLPLKIYQSYTDIDSVNIKLPSNFKIDYLPEKVEIKNKFGMYMMNLEKIDETHYLYTRKLKIVKGQFPKEMYDTYRKFRKQIRKYDNSKIILNKL